MQNNSSLLLPRDNMLAAHGHVAHLAHYYRADIVERVQQVLPRLNLRYLNGRIVFDQTLKPRQRPSVCNLLSRIVGYGC